MGGLSASSKQINFHIPTSQDTFVWYRGGRTGPTNATELMRLAGDTGSLQLLGELICTSIDTGGQGNILGYDVIGMNGVEGSYVIAKSAGRTLTFTEGSTNNYSNFPFQIYGNTNTNNIINCCMAFCQNEDMTFQNLKPSPGSVIQFLRTGNNSFGDLIFRIKANTNLRGALNEILRLQSARILANTPLSITQASLGEKICLFDGGTTSMAGLSLSTGQLNFHVNSTDFVFYTGGRTGPTNATELMRIKNNGFVGIGTNSPAHKLHVMGSIYAQTGDIYTTGDLFLRTGATRIYTGKVGVHGSWNNNPLPTNNTDASVWSYGDAESAFIAMNGDSIYMSSPIDDNAINYYDEDGMVLAFKIGITGSVVATSDERIKTDIRGISWDNILEKFKHLRPVTFKYKKPETCCRETCKYDQTHMGFIAQEVQSVFPELVSEEKDGLLNINMSMLIQPVILASQALIAENETLKLEVQTMKGLLETVMTRLNDLENEIRKSNWFSYKIS